MTTTDLQQALTARRLPCPECGGPMVGARVFDSQRQEAFVGVACGHCDLSFAVRDVENVA